MTVIDIVRNASNRYADNPALVDGANLFTHAQMWERVDRLSQALHGLGLRKGDVLLAWLPNTFRAVEAELACFASGAMWVTLNRSLTWAEVRGVIEATKPRVMIADPALLAAADSEPPHIPLVVTSAGDLPGAYEYEPLLAAHEALRPDVNVAECDVARLRYTSGTTGTSKAATLTHGVYLASLEVQQRELHRLGPADRALHAAPLTHASGALLYPLLAAGGANVILPGFDAENVLDTIAREGISAMFCVPTMLQRLAASPRFAQADLSSLKTITYGGAPTNPDKLAPLIERLPSVLVQIYGLTEAVHPVTVLRREEHVARNPRLMSIGCATHINDVQIQDNLGRAVKDGEVGELCVHGPNVMAGYWNDDAATAQAIREGWLLTGDVAYRDSEGYFYIVDRKKDVIISGGFNVYTAEVEHALVQHPDIIEAAVFGVPDDDWGEAVHAVVVAQAGAELDSGDVIAHCRRLIANYKAPKSVEVRMEPLPKSGVGKILKRELRAPYWEKQPRQVH